MTNKEHARCANCDHLMTDAAFIVEIEMMSETLVMHRGCAIADGFIDE